METSFWYNQAREISYPSKQSYTIYNVMKKGKIIHEKISLSELKELYPDQDNILSYLRNSHHVIETEFDSEGYRQEQISASKEYNKIKEGFKQALFEEHKVSGPKAEQLYEICSNRKSEFNEIEHDFSDFVELIY